MIICNHSFQTKPLVIIELNVCFSIQPESLKQVNLSFTASLDRAKCRRIFFEIVFGSIDSFNSSLHLFNFKR